MDLDESLFDFQITDDPVWDPGYRYPSRGHETAYSYHILLLRVADSDVVHSTLYYTYLPR